MSACRSACHRNFRKSRVGRVGEDPREHVRVGVGVGVVEFQLKGSILREQFPGYFLVANVTRKSLTWRACRTRYGDAKRMLRGSYKETAPVEFSLNHYNYSNVFRLCG